MPFELLGPHDTRERDSSTTQGQSSGTKLSAIDGAGHVIP
jgi:hypothetical protein